MTFYHKFSDINYWLFEMILVTCFASAMALATPAYAEDLPWEDVPQERGYIPDDTGEAPQSITPDVKPDYNAPPRRHYSAPPKRQYEGGQENYDNRPITEEEYSSNEILGAGHNFFGSVSVGLAKVVEHAFKSKGRPNGYILGEEASGAIIAGLRYGEGTLYTKSAGQHKVYWQGPSIGYDLGASGAKTMILAYNLYHPSDVYRTFGGITGSAYFIGGAGVTFLQRDHVNLAPIVAGVGLRLGANVGYLKFTPSPTWNPF